MVNSRMAPSLARRLHTVVNWSAPFQQEDRLYRRLSALKDIKGRVASTINEYIREGKSVSKPELDSCIREFRRYKRFHHALEIMDWMEVRKINFKHIDYGVRLELIAKVKGIAYAENYFSGLSPSTKVSSTYQALLSNYCEEKMTDKALDLFANMVKMNMVSRPVPFNKLMSLYIRLEQPEKVIVLGEEMKKIGIEPDTFTYNLLMHSYSDRNDIEGVERVFEEMKRENDKWCNWTSYSNLANLYIRGGFLEKAEVALKQLEKELGTNNNRKAYHFLISLYASISDIQSIVRVWKSLKSTFKVLTNLSYLIMLQALKKLDDINGMKELYEEWESACPSFDIRLTNTAISGYLKHDMLDDAMSVLENALRKSDGPFFNSWEMIMAFFLKKHQIKRALQILEVATSSSVSGGKEWRPRSALIDGFVEYFKEEEFGDVISADEFYKLMKKIKCVDSRIYEVLLQTYVAAGRITSVADKNIWRARIEGDGIEISSELQHLITIVCPPNHILLCDEPLS